MLNTRGNSEWIPPGCELQAQTVLVHNSLEFTDVIVLFTSGGK